MANRPPLPSVNSYNSGDPFAGRPPVVAFQEPNPFASSTTLNRDYQQQGEEPDDEKQPLTSYPGGFYPPAYAIFEFCRHPLVV
jgi:hypothetical protein